MARSLAGIVAAGGRGRRAGFLGATEPPKQFRHLGGLPLIGWSVRLLADAGCDPIVVVVPEGNWTDQLSGFDVRMVLGGDERQRSVRNGLELVDTDYVLVHDAARPFATVDLVRAVLDALTTDRLGDRPASTTDRLGDRPASTTDRLGDRPASTTDRLGDRPASKGAHGAAPAVPVADTLKEVRDGRVIRTVERSSLWAVQTPQAFATETLKSVHDKARVDGFVGTDDAQLVERYGGVMRIVEGARDNIKLTYPEDWRVAEAMIAANRGRTE